MGTLTDTKPLTQTHGHTHRHTHRNTGTHRHGLTDTRTHTRALTQIHEQAEVQLVVTQSYCNYNTS
jgi:hypothetical protein